MLAFARRQELKKEAIDIPELVRGMTELLQRSLGPSVVIQTQFPLVNKPVLSDANQLEMILLNLCVNAAPTPCLMVVEIVIATREEVLRPEEAYPVEARYVRLPNRTRYRHRNGRRDSEARDGAFLYNEGGRQGHRARTVYGARCRRTI